jgi:hypothetical protein
LRPELIAVRGRDPRVARWVESVAQHCRVTALEGPRGIDPRRFGVPSAGHDWYVEGDPAGFGLALAKLEAILLEREPGVWLVGDGQGASLVLALACCWPERLAGVIAIGGSLPELPEGSVAEAPLRGLHVILVGDCGDSAASLAARGARVSLRESAPDRRRRAASAR